MDSQMITHVNIIHKMVWSSLHTGLLVVKAYHLFEGFPIAELVDVQPIVTYSSLMLIVPFVMKVVATGAGESELVLTIEYKVLVVKELVLQFLNFNTHTSLFLAFSFDFLNTELGLVLLLLLINSTHALLLLGLVNRCIFPTGK